VVPEVSRVNLRVFKDRTEAGKMLAGALAFLKGEKGVIVLAIPRGGVPVAKEVAAAIGAPLDLVVTRKIGAPSEPELAVGAVTQDGEIIVDAEMMKQLGVSTDYLKQESARQVKEISNRMKKYRGNRPYPPLGGKTVVIVDDGIATGSTIRAAIQSVRGRKAAKIIVAAPVGPPERVAELSTIVDRVVCLSMPEYFEAIGQFYEEFDQVDDDTVREILGEPTIVRRAGAPTS
jgi:putative phosphoribosyl transferase